MSVLDEMVCQELVERVTEYLDAALTVDDRTRFESHLAECPFCEAILEQFLVVIDMTGHLGVNDVAMVDPERQEQLLSVFRSWHGDRR